MRCNLIAERKKKKLTQEQMAKLIDVSRTTYTAYELGTTTPSLDKAIAIKKVLKCKDDDIFLIFNVS